MVKGSNRIARRSFLRAGSSLLGAALLAPSFAGMSLAQNADGTSKRGGTLNIVIESEPNSLDPHASATSFTVQLVAQHYSSLLKYDPQDYPTVVGDLAESWVVSEDGRTITFRLREGVKFHDGSSLTSDDVKATFERLRNPPEGIISARKAQFSGVDTIETADPLTVIFVLKQRNPAFLQLLASPWNAIYSARLLAEDPNYPASRPMGTGPFRFVEYAKGSHWTSERFDDYFVPDRPLLDGIKAVFISGAGVTNALEGGQVDGNFFLLSPAAASRLKGRMGDRMYFPQSSFNNITFVTINTAKAPFDDVRVRKALNLTLDRVEGMQFLATLASQERPALLMPTASPFRVSDDDIKKLPGFEGDPEKSARNREEARRLLKEAGHENLRLTLLNRNIR